MVAPSFVTSILPSLLETLCKILSMPFGPSVLFHEVGDRDGPHKRGHARIFSFFHARFLVDDALVHLGLAACRAACVAMGMMPAREAIEVGVVARGVQFAAAAGLSVQKAGAATGLRCKLSSRQGNLQASLSRSNRCR